MYPKDALGLAPIYLENRTHGGLRLAREDRALSRSFAATAAAAAAEAVATRVRGKCLSDYVLESERADLQHAFSRVDKLQAPVILCPATYYVVEARRSEWISS